MNCQNLVFTIIGVVAPIALQWFSLSLMPVDFIIANSDYGILPFILLAASLVLLVIGLVFNLILLHQHGKKHEKCPLFYLSLFINLGVVFTAVFLLF